MGSRWWVVRAQPKSNPQLDREEMATGSLGLSPGTKHILLLLSSIQLWGKKGNKVVQETILVLVHTHSVARAIPKVSLKTKVPEEGHIWLLFVLKFQFSWLVP